MNANHTKAD